MGKFHADFDEKGYPTSVFVNKTLITTEMSVGVVSSKTPVDPLKVGEISYYGWGDGDKFPDSAIENIEDKKGNPVLSRTLNMLVDVLCGQGIVPVRITGIDPVTKLDTYELVPELYPMLRKPWVNDYLAEAFRDLKKLGNAFVQFRPTLDGTKISKIHCINSRHGRLVANENENYPKAMIVGRFPEATAETTTKYDLLDRYDPEEDLAVKVPLKKVFFHHIKDNFSNGVFYSSATWTTATTWLEISNKLPKSINNGLDNILNIAFLIRIPWSYWQQKYPEEQVPDPAERMALITADLKKLEENFTSVEKARRALITHFGQDPAHPEADKWEIDVVKIDLPIEILKNATAADSYVAIAGGGHPDILGLIFGNSKGGSMQREILLILYALTWRLRQAVIRPLEMMIRFNDPKYEDVELMFKQVFLTALDAGGSTGEVLS